MSKTPQFKGIRKDINETYRANIREHFILVKDTVFTWLKIQLFSLFNDRELRAKVNAYLFLVVNQHLTSIKNERKILSLMSEALSIETEDDTIDFLMDLDELMEQRYTDYDSFLANYDELIFSGFTEYNYKHISRTECFIDEKKVEEASKIFTKEKR